ncbi:hypothetical protein CG430_22910, partial [Pantoea ananatis]
SIGSPPGAYGEGGSPGRARSSPDPRLALATVAAAQPWRDAFADVSGPVPRAAPEPMDHEAVHPVLPSPRLLDPRSVPTLRWGVVGTGIAGPFVRALHARTAQRAVAVAARDREKTEAFAREHGIPTVHRNVTALIEDPQVDVV